MAYWTAWKTFGLLNGALLTFRLRKYAPHPRCVSAVTLRPSALARASSWAGKF
jgi:hypothetical protein